MCVSQFGFAQPQHLLDHELVVFSLFFRKQILNVSYSSKSVKYYGMFMVTFKICLSHIPLKYIFTVTGGLNLEVEVLLEMIMKYKPKKEAKKRGTESFMSCH